jgi:hypothetical protein
VKKRKRNSFHSILSKFCTLNTTTHQSHTVSLKANNHDNHSRRAKYVTKCEEINIAPITNSQIGFVMCVTTSTKLSITYPNYFSSNTMNPIFKLHC